jgi:hypothetical protein
MAHECVIEIFSCCDCSKLPVVGQLQFDGATRRRTKRDIATRRPARHRRRRQPESVEQPQGTRSQAVAAAFVARERGLVNDDDTETCALCGDRGSDSGRPGADDEDIGAP